MMTLQNTEGYTQEQLDILNVELLERLQDVDPNDLDQIEFTKKAFADEVSRR